MPFSCPKVQVDNSPDYGLQMLESVGDPEQYRPPAPPVPVEDTEPLRWKNWAKDNGWDASDDQRKQNLSHFYHDNIIPKIANLHKIPVDQFQGKFIAKNPYAARYNPPPVKQDEYIERDSVATRMGLSGDAKQNFVLTGEYEHGGQSEKLFDGSSIQGQALNKLVETGSLSRQQALQLAAGKTLTAPDGSTMFLTPEGVFNNSANNQIDNQANSRKRCVRPMVSAFVLI